MAQRQGQVPSLEAFDGEFGSQHDNSAQAPKANNRIRRVTLLGLLFGMGAIGVLALAWPLTAVSSRSDGRSNEQFDRLVRERDALKKQINELIAAQQKTIATVAVLDANVRELRQRVPPDQYWYSDLAALYFRIAAGQPSSVTPIPRTSAELREPEASEKNAPRRNQGAPLSLVPPQ